MGHSIYIQTNKHTNTQRLLTDAFATNWTLHERFMLAEIDGAESVVDAVERVEHFDPDAPEAPTKGDQGRGSGSGKGVVPGVGAFAAAAGGRGASAAQDTSDALASRRVEETAEILEDFQRRMLVGDGGVLGVGWVLGGCHLFLLFLLSIRACMLCGMWCTRSQVACKNLSCVFPHIHICRIYTTICMHNTHICTTTEPQSTPLT